MSRRRVMLAALAAALIVPAASAGALPRGALTLLHGSGGCLGTGCTALRGPTGLLALAISPDGANIYASGQAGGLAVLARDARTGRVRQLAGRAGCFRHDGHQGCTRLTGLTAPSGIAVTPDGASVYVATSTGIQAFARNRRTGALRPSGCLDSARSACGLLRAPADPTTLLAAGNRVVYAAGTVTDATATTTGALAVLARDPRTGRLTQLAGTAGCVDIDGSVGCTPAPCLDEITAMTLDGTRLYTGSTNSLDFELTSPGDVATFARNGATGALHELGCRTRTEAIADIVAIPRGVGVLVATLFGNRGTGISYGSLDLYRPSGGVLARVRKLACVSHQRCPIPFAGNVTRVAVTPRGDTVYVAAELTGLTIYHRSASGLTVLPGTRGCIVSPYLYQPPPGCAREGQDPGYDMVASPDGRNLYLGTSGPAVGDYYAGGLEAFAIAP